MWKPPGMDRLGTHTAARTHQPFRAMAGEAAPDHPKRGRADDAQLWRPVGYQRKIHCELVTAGNKFPRAVEWIDQKKTAVTRRLRPRGAFLRYGPDSGCEPCEAVGDDTVGGVVGFRDRRSVHLAGRAHGAAINVKKGKARLTHEFGQRFHQRGRIFRCDRAGRRLPAHWRSSLTAFVKTSSRRKARVARPQISRVGNLMVRFK